MKKLRNYAFAAVFAALFVAHVFACVGYFADHAFGNNQETWLLFGLGLAILTAGGLTWDNRAH